ncbi:hypothetical protein FNF27_05446 [Cafeteria roenbergensis]|uniref:Uncharacterized protein n=1 Tax=Cafeteria roenbergensis TaxID=33653 RepID=A0A5A8E8F2_CAFRO|nr:hypothetical protein FNF27_05446 [Cafeteria roenbergensis]
MFGLPQSKGLYDDGASEDDSVLEEDVGLTENQQRLLWLIHLHSRPALTADDTERWARHQSIMVLVYEGVVAQALDYDYAPSPEVVDGRRMFFNVSQEGKSDLDYLREEKLVNGLKVSSRDHLPVTMYQISRRGLEVIRGIDEYDRSAVESFARSPSRALMVVDFDGSDFWLAAADEEGLPVPGGFRKKSSVLAIEEVSYVSSAYIPACLRHGGRPTLSNAHRVHECTSSAAGTIRDDLEEIITLSSVSIIVGEYVPFGSNQMVSLNFTMGSPERVLGGFYTAAVQDDASRADFRMDPGLTAVQILDYSLAGHVNLEADIQLPEPDGIVQIETFGVSINANGACFYGLQLEAVMDRVKDAISLDHLSRLLVDVQTDSSEIVEPLLSPAQRRALDFVYRGDSANRAKVSLIVANEIVPHLQAEEYLDKGEYENELKQVVGDTRAAYGISDSDTLVFGSHGLLLAGPNSRTYEPLLCSYVQLMSMDAFAQNLFSVVSVVQDDIRATASQCRLSRRDPLLLKEASARLPTLERRVLLLEKIVSFMEESLLSTEIPEPPLTAAGRALYDRLALPQLQSEMARRVTDIGKYVRETGQELSVTQRQAQHIAESRDRDVMGSLETHVVALREAAGSPNMARMVYALEWLQWILMSLFAFACLDRLVGTWSVADTDWFRSVYQALIERGPMVWFLLSFLLLAAMTWFMAYRYNRRARRELQDTVTVRLEIRQSMNQARLDKFLAIRTVLNTSWDLGPEGDRVVVSWIEDDDYATRWSGVKPRMVMTYSAQLSQILAVEVSFQRSLIPDRATHLSPQDLRDRVLALLDSNDVLVPDEFAPELVMGPSEAAKDAKRKRALFARAEAEDDGDSDLAPPAPFSRINPADEGMAPEKAGPGEPLSARQVQPQPMLPSETRDASQATPRATGTAAVQSRAGQQAESARPAGGSARSAGGSASGSARVPFGGEQAVPGPATKDVARPGAVATSTMTAGLPAGTMLPAPADPSVDLEEESGRVPGGAYQSAGAGAGDDEEDEDEDEDEGGVEVYNGSGSPVDDDGHPDAKAAGPSGTSGRAGGSSRRG